MKYDLLMKNGKIHTIDPDMSICSWVAVKEGKIAALGRESPAGIEAVRVIDLAGRTMLPGLMDCHVHVMVAGLTLNAVDLAQAKDIREVLALMEEGCLRAGEEEWVFGVNYVTQNIEEQRYPNRFELDEISGDKMVMLIAATLHGCATNTRAMKVCSVPDDMPGVEKADGRETGVYSSDESSFLANANAFGSMSDDKLWSYIRDCADNAVKKGVTTMHGLFGQFVAEDRDMDLIIRRKDELPLEMVVFYQTWDVDLAREMGLPRVGGCLTLDGASFEYTMANFEPYNSAPALRGVLYHNDEEVYQVVKKAHQYNMQCSMHALGERAIDQLIYTYRRVMMEQGEKDLRHRIEHFSLPTEGQIQMAAELKLILSMQPGFTYYWDRPEGGEFEYMFGRERANRWDPFHRVIEAGNIVCGGSDCPVTPVEPLVDIAACVNGYNPVRNISVDEALKMYTINGAFAADLEKKKGSIEIGKDADFTVIDRDPYEYADKWEIYEMEALMTIRGGEIIWEKQPAER